MVILVTLRCTSVKQCVLFLIPSQPTRRCLQLSNVVNVIAVLISRTHDSPAQERISVFFVSIPAQSLIYAP